MSRRSRKRREERAKRDTKTIASPPSKKLSSPQAVRLTSPTDLRPIRVVRKPPPPPHPKPRKKVLIEDLRVRDPTGKQIRYRLDLEDRLHRMSREDSRRKQQRWDRERQRKYESELSRRAQERRIRLAKNKPVRVKMREMVPGHIYFKEAKRVMICVRRRIRREVLMALGRAGKGSGRHDKKHRNEYSEIRC